MNRRFGLLIFLFITACAGHRSPAVPMEKPCLMHPGKLPVHCRFDQEVEIVFQDKSIIGRSVISISKNSLEVLVVSTFGVKLLYLIQSDDGVQVLYKAPGLTEFDPLYMIRDIQWMLYASCFSENTVAGGSYRECGYRITDTRSTVPGETVIERRIEGNGERINVEFSDFSEFRAGMFPGTTVLRNAQRNYRIKTLTLAVDRIQ